MNSINNTLFIGKVFYHYDKLSSTNVLAAEMLKTERLPEGTMLSTFCQTAGKGQASTTWESEPNKNLSLSVVLYPHFIAPSDQFLLNQAVALGVYDFVRLFVREKVSIKWSNDIYVGDKKIAGILVQNSLSEGKIQHSIVGIGINVNQQIFKSNAPNPTAIFLESGKEVNLWSAIEFLSKYLENRYLQLRSGQFKLLNDDYDEVLYRKGTWHFYEADGERFVGKIVGVKPDGRLHLETADGERFFDFKTIKFLFD